MIKVRTIVKLIAVIFLTTPSITLTSKNALINNGIVKISKALDPDLYNTYDKLPFDIENKNETLNYAQLNCDDSTPKHQSDSQNSNYIRSYYPPPSAFGDLQILHPALKIENLITIYIVADRYVDTEQNIFFDHARAIANHIVGIHPFSEYKSWIQIYAIGTISTSSSTSVLVGSGSGTKYNDINVTHVQPFISYHFPTISNPSIPDNQFWLVVQRGSPIGYAYVDNSPNVGLAVANESPGSCLHEMAHLWGLWDEYNSLTNTIYRNKANIRSNVDLTNPTTGTLSDDESLNTAIPPEWGLFIGALPGTNNQWVGIENIGVYLINPPGAGSTSWYRPSHNCVMNQADNTGPGSLFCQVCQEYIFRRFSTNRQIYQYSTSNKKTTITGLTNIGKNLTNDLIIPVAINGGLVTKIGDGNSAGYSGSKITKISFATGTQVKTLSDYAFSGSTFLTEINIPKTVNSIGNNAFYGTNGAPIYIDGKTNSPATFHYNWNSSYNPVYMNNMLCQHTSKPLIKLSSNKHGMMCTTCRTTTNIANHNYTYDWRSYTKHYSSCLCESGLEGHFVSSSDSGFPYKTCLKCGGPASVGFVGPNSNVFSPFGITDDTVEYFGNGSYILSNGVYVISDADLDAFYEETLELENCEH